MKIFANKKLVLLFFVLRLMAPLCVVAQEWAPIGAKWNYSIYQILDPIVFHFGIESTGDTTINGKSCKSLVFTEPQNCDGTITQYIYADSNKVYYYDQVGNDFNLLYDFDANTNDSWKVITNSPADSFTVNVDSTSSITINSNTLKVLYISSSSLVWDFAGMAIDRIGLTSYFFPQYGLCDPFVRPLRCYEDSTIGLYNTNEAPVCEGLYTSIKAIENSESENIKIYPTMMSEAVINIQIPEELLSKYNKLKLFDPMGRLVHTQNLSVSESIIQLNNNLSGVLFLTISGDKHHVRKTIIIYN